MPRTLLTDDIETLRQRAEKIIRKTGNEVGPADPADLASALEELRIHGAELEIQNEELQRERTQAEALQQRYFRHFDLAPVGMIRLNRQGIILEANILGATMLGIERVTLAFGKVAFAARVAHESQGIFHAHLRGALDMVAPMASKKMEFCELTLRDEAGAKFVRMQTVVSCGADGARDLLVTLIDLTERQELEGGLARQKDIAEAATRAKDIFFAMLSHELRTPLTPALMLLDELGHSPALSEQDRVALETIRRNLKQEVLLIDDLLDLTRISKGRLALDREVTDAHLCVNRALEDSLQGIQEKHLEVEIDLAAPQHMAYADSHRLQQIVSNLIRNAVKFTSSGGNLSIHSFNSSEKRLEIEFTDSGIGIEAEAIADIFDPFAQATPSIQGRFGGLGLGLAISRSLAQAHGGFLTASSDGLGKGSTFHLELPALEAGARPAVVAPASAPHLPRRDNLRLLLIENHDDTRSTLQRLLARRGYQVQTAADSSSALALCAANEFDLVISDIGLPDRSGLELMKDIRTLYRIPGVAMSGFGMDTDVAKSKAAGFSEHLTKPIDFDNLDSTLQRVASAEQ